MGLLTGKLTSSGLRAKTDTRSRELLRYLEGGEPEGSDFPGTAGSVPKGGLRSLLATLTKVAAKYKKTPAQISLNWIICKGAIPIPGASSEMQINENGGALGWRLSSDDVAV